MWQFNRIVFELCSHPNFDKFTKELSVTSLSNVFENRSKLTRDLQNVDDDNYRKFKFAEDGKTQLCRKCEAINISSCLVNDSKLKKTTWVVKKNN